MTQNLEIDSADVIRLVMQFLAENNLPRSLQVLQEESGVSLNAVDSIDGFIRDVRGGRWDGVLRAAATSKLKEETQLMLYEQILYEMLELREIDIAKLLLKETAVFQSLKTSQPDKYKRLDALANAANFDAKEIYQSANKEKRRMALAQAMSVELESVSPSRLLTLIGMALNYQKQQGLLPSTVDFNLFTNSVKNINDNKEKYPQDIAKSIRFGSKTHAESAAFSPDGRHLVIGFIDGFIEVWDWQSCTLNKDITYQKENNLMMHNSAVMAVAFSRDSEALASGSQDGQLKVWLISTGQCIRKIDRAHDAAITSVAFSKDNTQLLTGSLDTTARIHGLKSGRMMKEFRGHLTFVNSALFLPDNTKVLTGSADGKIKIWDAKTQECLASFHPPPPPHEYCATSSRN